MASNFDYTSRDFSTVRSELLRRAAQSLPEWTDRDPGDFMMVMIDLFSYASDVMHFYIDRAAGESFLNTATQRESILALANLYDYTPNFVRSATSNLTVYNGSNASVSIPAGTAFTGTVGGTVLRWYSTSAATAASSTSVTIGVRQGTQYLDQGVTSSTGSNVSDGQGSQRFNLYHKGVDPSTITVNVYEGANDSAKQWRRVQRLVTSSANDSVYSVYVTADNITQIVFGNGINGRIPRANVRITASYTVSDGANGNVPANSITTFTSSGFQGCRVNAATAGVGGVDAENTDSMKTSIPSVFRAANRAVTLQDFSDLALRVEGVAKATSVYSSGSGTGGSVSVFAVPYQGGYSTASSVTSISVDQNTRERVYSDLISSAMLGVSTIAVRSTVTTTPVYVAVDIYVDDNYTTSTVKSQAEAAIQDFFSFENASFGKIITTNDLYKKINDVPGVNHCVVTDLNTTSLSSGLTGSGKVTIAATSLPRNGGIQVTASGGITDSI